MRSCQCSFCRRHGASTAHDPKGSARIEVRDAAALVRYRFGRESVDFLLCARCGVYLGASLEDRFVTLNVNAFETSPLDCGRSVSYEDESAEASRARREASWTPLESFDVG